MRIARWIRDELVEQALARAPLECCGLLAGEDDEVTMIARVPNAAESSTRFELDGPAHLRALESIADHELDVLAVYHSHTLAPAEPSESDLQLCSDTSLLQVIVGVMSPDWPEVRCWRYREDGTADEVPIEVTG